MQEQFQKNPDSYNGAVRENYTWSQDYTDLEVRVPVPKHVVKGKQVIACGQGFTAASLSSRQGAGMTARGLGLVFGYDVLFSKEWLPLLALASASLPVSLSTWSSSFPGNSEPTS